MNELVLFFNGRGSINGDHLVGVLTRQSLPFKDMFPKLKAMFTLFQLDVSLSV